MKRLIFAATLCFAVVLPLSGCGSKTEADPASEAPPPVQIEHEQNFSGLEVEHPEQLQTDAI